MDKKQIVETISAMSDKQKAKVLAIVLEEFSKENDNGALGRKVHENFEAAIRWLA